ncbi:hypothetical protein HC891_01625 [Candidatus Gracilibacteria bacterium]|nr:hypothetical protein [Candidatus Gracilibacteria bacterium]
MARKASATRVFSNSEIRIERLRARRRSYPAWRLARANWLDVVTLMRSGGWIPLVALLIVVLSSTLYLLLVYFPAECIAIAPAPCDLPGIFEALYETLQLIVFQSGLDFPSDFLGRLLFFLVPLLGLFFLLQSLVDLARQLFNKGARREEWQVSLASTYSDHIIVCGLGRVGYRVTLQLLDAGYDVVAIDINWQSHFVKAVLGLNTPLIHGDARDPEVLRKLVLSAPALSWLLSTTIPGTWRLRSPRAAIEVTSTRFCVFSTPSSTRALKNASAIIRRLAPPHWLLPPSPPPQSAAMGATCSPFLRAFTALPRSPSRVRASCRAFCRISRSSSMCVSFVTATRRARAARRFSQHARSERPCGLPRQYLRARTTAPR